MRIISGDQRTYLVVKSIIAAIQELKSFLQNKKLYSQLLYQSLV